MGSALARAFQNAGRHAHRMEPQPRQGSAVRGLASVAGTARDAVAASATVVISLLDYGAANACSAPRKSRRRAGKTVVQLTTGTPADARDRQSVGDRTARSYLDGAIAGYPRTIGTDANEIFYAGDASVFDAQRDVSPPSAGRRPSAGRTRVPLRRSILRPRVRLRARSGPVSCHRALHCRVFPLEVFFATAGARPSCSNLSPGMTSPRTERNGGGGRGAAMGDHGRTLTASTPRLPSTPPRSRRSSVPAATPASTTPSRSTAQTLPARRRPRPCHP